MIKKITTAFKARLFGNKENEKGFTLIELLVVVLIIGILSAIAIPIFLNQQAAARDSAVQADVTNSKTALLSYMVLNPNEPFPTDDAEFVTAIEGEFTGNADVTLTWDTTNTTSAFCISGVNDLNAGDDQKTFAASDKSGAIEGTCVSGVATPVTAAD